MTNVTSIQPTNEATCSMNPLRVDDQPGEDTRGNVRDVLSFIGDAFLAIGSAKHCMVSPEAFRGCYQIMALCADALREEKKGARPDGG